MLAAVTDRDPGRLRPLLHPYLHWTGPDGAVTRGRTRVLALLAAAPDPDPPAAVELRDGQVYRWVCRPGGVSTRTGTTSG
ncbi:MULTISPECIES: hypothetical protein [unclassified Geodermatophilus]